MICENKSQPRKNEKEIEISMTELWDIALSLIGAGCVILGYVIHWLDEKRRRTHEKEVEYQRELKKHIPDLIEPLFKLLGDLWYSSIELTNPDRVEYSGDVLIVKGRKLMTPIREVREALDNLNDFVRDNENKLDLLLPHPLQSWQYANLRNFVNGILKDARKGKLSLGDVAKAVDTTIDIQDDLQKIVGFETKIRLKSERAFKKPLTRFERFKRKLRRS